MESLVDCSCGGVCPRDLNRARKRSSTRGGKAGRPRMREEWESGVSRGSVGDSMASTGASFVGTGGGTKPEVLSSGREKVGRSRKRSVWESGFSEVSDGGSASGSGSGSFVGGGFKSGRLKSVFELLRGSVDRTSPSSSAFESSMVDGGGRKKVRFRGNR